MQSCTELDQIQCDRGGGGVPDWNIWAPIQYKDVILPV